MMWGMLSGIITALLIIAFAAIFFWAYSPARRRRFDEAAQLALAPEDQSIRVEDMEQRQ